MGVYYPRARAILQVVFDGLGGPDEDSEVHQIPVIPKSVRIHRNGYNDADEWDMTIDAGDLPVDPQLIRQGQVEIYLFDAGSMSNDPDIISREFAGMDPQASYQGTAAALSRELDDEGGKRAKAAFVKGQPTITGIFDDFEMNLGEQNEISIRGKDLTAMFQGVQWKPNKDGSPRRIPVGKRLDKWAEDIIEQCFPGGNSPMKVVLDEGVNASELPVVGRDETNANKYGIPVEEGTSYWDVLHKVVSRCAYVCHVQNLDFIISLPRQPDLASVQPVRLAWGANINTLKMSRHLAKDKVPQIVINSYDPSTRKNIQVAFPTVNVVRAKKGSKKGKGVAEIPVGTMGAKTNEYMLVQVVGITDERILRRMAENMFQVMGRGERKYVITTSEMMDMQQNPRPLLDLVSGDAVQVDFVGLDAATLGSKSDEERVQYLVNRGYNAAVARVLAKHHTMLTESQRPMRVHEISFDWEADGGLTVEIELQDFIVINADRTPELEAATRGTKR